MRKRDEERGYPLAGRYGYIGLYFVIAFLFPAIMILFSLLLRYLRARPSNPDPVKSSTYECGNETVGETWIQFNFRYYLYALLFVLFDIEAIFLYPWAVAYKQLKLFGLVEMVIFVLILMVGYFYAWKKRALEWQ